MDALLNYLLYCLSRTDKWAETELGTKWGDKWEEKFFAGIGSRQGETWHVSPSDERMSNSLKSLLTTDKICSTELPKKIKLLDCL